MSKKELLASDKNLLYQHKNYPGLDDDIHWVRLSSTWYFMEDGRYHKELEVEKHIFTPDSMWSFRELTTDQLVEVTLNQLLQ